MDGRTGMASAEMLADLDESGERALAAAHELFVRGGIRRTSIDDVARAAGLGRATVYRKFATKDDLVAAVLRRELDEWLRTLDDATRDIAAFEQRNVEGFVATVRYMRDRSILSAVVEHDDAWGQAYYNSLAAPLLFGARDYLARRLRQAQEHGVVPVYDPGPVAELVVRVCHSLALTPGGVVPLGDDEAARRFARDVLVPIIVGGRIR